MRYAFYPGCSAKATCPELYQSTLKIADRLGIELPELTSAACCGGDVMQDQNPDLVLALNARTLAIAEEHKLDILTVCNVCTQRLSRANKEMKSDPDVMAKANAVISQVGHTYKGGVNVTHLLWLLVQGEGAEALKKNIRKPLTGLKVAPFYGCQILRPSQFLGFEDPSNPSSLETLIRMLGAEPVDYDGKDKCCGFMTLTVEENNSMKLTGRQLGNAKLAGADLVVTPCPLCHLTLDVYQPEASRARMMDIELPILHLPQLVGLAMGLSPAELGLHRNVQSPKKVLAKVG